ncbi:Protein of unknown function [Cupriavidus sp. YR651]|uniref:DUF2523 family protein n=1 Tax=Cupriavidus sp. YR651 TaxID=1855315 RepID=UPI00088F195B|nr:DUF2523 family protein [Cupriavidus sp. YR651]SDC52346.1 Protein of unknown function [Cupriavidus sp. YR651]
MGAFFTAILLKIVKLATWLGSLAVAAFAAAWLLGTDLGCWLVEGLLKMTQTALNGLPGTDAFAAMNPAQYISGMPPDLVNMIGLVRVGESLAIILAAILIKLTLQVIPFTRLGS